MDWEKKILCTYLKLPFFAPFSLQAVQCWIPKHRQKEETGGRILALFPPCLYQLAIWALAPWGHWGAAAQLLTLWLYEGKREQKAVENGREIMQRNAPIFQEDSPANKDWEKEKPHWTWMPSGGCPN